DMLDAGHALFKLRIKPQDSRSFEVRVSTRCGATGPIILKGRRTHSAETRSASRRYSEWRRGGVTIETDNPEFDQLLDRSLRDLYILRQRTPQGWGMGAG